MWSCKSAARTGWCKRIQCTGYSISHHDDDMLELCGTYSAICMQHIQGGQLIEGTHRALLDRVSFSGNTGLRWIPRLADLVVCESANEESSAACACRAHACQAGLCQGDQDARKGGPRGQERPCDPPIVLLARARYCSPLLASNLAWSIRRDYSLVRLAI